MKKKIFTALAVMMLTSLIKMPVLAGNINAEEQRIINAISAVYEYDGAYYKVTDAYISQVTIYLSSDGIDLSASEVDDYLNQFYANFAVGISAGYMECVGKVESEKKPEQSKPEEENDQDEGSESDSDDKNENTQEAGQIESTVSDTEEESETLIEDAIKISNDGEFEASVDNTKGSTIDGVQEYTVAEMEPQPMYVWDIEELTVHAEAYKDSEILGTLQEGDKVIVIGAATTGWAQIEYGDGVAYVSATYLRTPGYMKGIGFEIEEETTAVETEIETETESEVVTMEEESTVSKDYSEAEPYQQGVSLGIIAIVIVIVVAIAMVCVLLWHKNRRYRR